MTPIEIFEYKNKWKPGFSIRLHSDLVNEGKTWCRKNMARHEWSMTEWTNVYEHTFHFENENNAKQFKEKFNEYADQLQV